MQPVERNTGRAAGEHRAGLRLRELAFASHDDVLALLHTGETGLAEDEAARRLARDGANVVREEAPRAWPLELAAAYPNPFNLLLTALAAVAAALGDAKTSLVLALMIALGTGVRFALEFRAAHAVRRLRERVPAMATVHRRDARYGPGALWNPRNGIEVPAAQLVAGDIVLLRAGDVVPADVRVLSARGLVVSQASLTGESLSVAKRESIDAAWSRDEPAVPDLPNICCMGTSVVGGHALAVVAATGDATYFGRVAATLRGHAPATSFDRGVRDVGWMLVRFTLVLIPLVLLVNGLIKGDWLQALTFALAVGVGLTPEMLPVVVTGALARGATQLARRRVITRRLNAIQGIGAMDVLCVDKTGTLTCDAVVLERCVDPDGRSGERAFGFATLDARHRAGDDAIDRAVLAHAALDDFAERWTRVAELPFDAARRRTGVVVRPVGGGPDLLVAKGAVDEMLAMCSAQEENEAATALTPERRASIRRLVRDLDAGGARVIAVATRALDAGAAPEERDLVLQGFLAFADPVKDDAGAALRELAGLGIAIKVVTGDSESAARGAMARAGLAVGEVLDGAGIERLADAELAEAAARATLFAKVTPMQKARVVRALRTRGATVGYLGDGINDAAAMREADVGLCVDTAVPVARAAADLVLLAPDLRIVADAVREGRRMFGNIMKYLRMATSSNFGNVLSVLAASALLPFLPMLPIQLVVQNLLYDASQILLPWDRVDDEFVSRPRRWQPDSILRFVLCIGPVSTLFDLATFAVLWRVFAADAQQQALFHTGWFVVGLSSQTLIVHVIRTRALPFVRSAASWPLVAATTASVLAALVLPFTPAGSAIGLVPLPGGYFLWLAAVLVLYAAATQFAKTLYIRRYGEWL